MVYTLVGLFSRWTGSTFMNGLANGNYNLLAGAKILVFGESCWAVWVVLVNFCSASFYPVSLEVNLRNRNLLLLVVIFFLPDMAE